MKRLASACAIAAGAPVVFSTTSFASAATLVSGPSPYASCTADAGIGTSTLSGRTSNPPQAPRGKRRASAAKIKRSTNDSAD